MQLCIFEDSNCMNFEPLVYSRPVFDLVCGMSTLKEKILRSYPKTGYTLLCRNYIAPVVKEQNPSIKVNDLSEDSYLFINGSLIAPPELRKILPLKHKTDKVYKTGDKIIAAFISRETFVKIGDDIKDTIDPDLFDGLPVNIIDVKNASYLWDLINFNGGEIENDFNFTVSGDYEKKKIHGKVHKGAHLINKKNIIVEKGAEIRPGSVIDASAGPVFISRNVLIHSNSVVEGPAFIGRNTHIKTGAYIHDNVSICETCKIGGEVEDAVFLPYSNKQHAGFIGHAYVGSWVNFGADTNCSDLKNNYGFIKTAVNGKLTDSNSQFLGLMIGDHSKSGINTMFNTGTNAGFSSNIFGAGFPDKHIPSFSWGGINSTATYDLNKAKEVARKVMERRNKQMTEAEEELFDYIFEITKEERSKRELPG